MSQSKIPEDSYNLEVFAIKGNEAFIGFKTKNGNFNFIQVPYTEPKVKSYGKSRSSKGK